MIRSIVLAALATALLSSAATAATLTATGSVMVNSGTGFKTVVGTVAVRPGDRVLVGANSEARVAYSPTCVTRVAPHAMLSVLASPPCDGMMNSGARNRTQQPVATETVIGDVSLLVPFGALAAGGVAGAIINTRGGGAPLPASP